MYKSIPHRFVIDRFPQSEQNLLAEVDSLIARVRAEKPYVLGFPSNLNFGYSHLAGVLDVLVNNVGDPHSVGKSDAVAKAMERSAVEFMARLSNGEPARTYGYVTSGGSEANQFGLDRGCDTLPEAMVYCSTAAHYSIRKNVRLMRKELVVVDCDESGRMDVAALGRACRRAEGRGAVVVTTAGTTMTGAIDDVEAVAEAAGAAGPVYIHLDAAIGGLILPFTTERDSWGFAHPEVGSVTVSMHKGLGMPVPCAVALCRSGLVDSYVEEFIDATDATLGCSRSGLASVLLWYGLARIGAVGLARSAWRALDIAQYALGRLEVAGLNPVLHPFSTVVVFDRPDDWICQRFHLFTQGGAAHIVTTGHVTTAMIDELCDAVGAGALVREEG